MSESSIFLKSCSFFFQMSFVANSEVGEEGLTEVFILYHLPLI